MVLCDRVTTFTVTAQRVPSRLSFARAACDRAMDSRWNAMDSPRRTATRNYMKSVNLNNLPSTSLPINLPLSSHMIQHSLLTMELLSTTITPPSHPSQQY
ncbi:hypothetical protein E2C01_072618 [Portunus trituberculatus]|uniref:Uncharacterized protein n=1 Tax=Portunus trituberculatus TaxID=210409 RepID=A0A5B7IB75_PORTR|nr:hypothetical protein [Portunus trituberculatus]